MTETHPPDTLERAVEPVHVEPWPNEGLLLLLVALASGFIWLALAVSLLGLAFALLLGLILFLARLLFVARVRGSAVRLGPGQMPDLHARVEEISRRLGLETVPEAYVMQAGGALDALAVRFLQSEILVLFSDLLDACGDDESARDMIIGREMGRLRAGHLRWRWFLLPGMLVPLLGSAFSRARQHTCDRYGAAVCGDRSGALRGLAILAAGGRAGRSVDPEAFARQQEALDTGWMTLGSWLATRPTMAARLAALDPDLVEGRPPLTQGRLRALLLVAGALLIPLVGASVFLSRYLPEIQEFMREASSPGGTPAGPPVVEDVEGARQHAIEEMASLARVIEEYRVKVGRLPDTETVLYDAWALTHPDETEPMDPFDGQRYGYTISKGEWWLWSAGPDGISQTDDDIWYDAQGPYE